MKTFHLLIIIIFISIELFSQTEEEILSEAKLLYYSEKASWIGTDILLEKFPEKRNQLGGYFSYSEDNNHKCIFFNNDSLPIVLATIAFDNSFTPENTNINITEREFTAYENDLYIIRKKTLSEISSDTLFKKYNNTNLNPVPIISEKKKKVYILTGPVVSGVVVLGNDYLLVFDKNNNLKSKECLHKNIIPITYNDETKDAVTIHSHLESTGDLITATDICTIMLYEKYAHWKTHYVISNKNVSIWNCVTDQLFVMTRKAWDRINESQNENNK